MSVLMMQHLAEPSENVNDLTGLLLSLTALALVAIIFFLANWRERSFDDDWDAPNDQHGE